MRRLQGAENSGTSPRGYYVGIFLRHAEGWSSRNVLELVTARHSHGSPEVQGMSVLGGFC